MLKIFLSVNAFSLLAFFRNVPLGIKKTHSVSVMTLSKDYLKSKVIEMLRIPLLELILKHGSSRIRPGTKYCSLSLVQRRFSPRNTWWVPYHFSFLPNFLRTTRGGIILPLRISPVCSYTVECPYIAHRHIYFGIYKSIYRI